AAAGSHGCEAGRSAGLTPSRTGEWSRSKRLREILAPIPRSCAPRGLPGPCSCSFNLPTYRFRSIFSLAQQSMAVNMFAATQTAGGTPHCCFGGGMSSCQPGSRMRANSVSTCFNSVNMNESLRVIPCCPPISQAELSSDEAEQLATTLKAVADPARIRLLSLIQAQPQGEACVCHLTEPLGLGQPTVSHHLRVLEDAGFLTHERRGRWVYYRAVPERLAAVREAFAPSPRRAASHAKVVNVSSKELSC